MDKPPSKRARIEDPSSANIDDALLKNDQQTAASEAVVPTTEAQQGETHDASNELENKMATALAAVAAAASANGGEYPSVVSRQAQTSASPYDHSRPNGSASAGVDGHEPTISVGDSSFKPSAGSEEWHKIRRDNHKEVERRRREAINKGISELATIVPDCEKHKGQILQKTVDYIKKLKDNEQRNMEKLTLEKLLTEQAISELSATNKALKQELAQAWKEVEHWKQACGASTGADASKSADAGSK
ncbi:Cbf1p [Sugiyamaella lignohabitans]|uniref:Cbf1p n=1 Tax=Sugiyamaella lignohabitans TaxID=796027 RepID=A0A167E899_9ASCO|nr:Cbf1p [Sugiyamaella lignohabitans]ANB13763.1 Cbf1p [Sugiyamaella lignohabitans]